jgi:hypothetical protein
MKPAQAAKLLAAAVKAKKDAGGRIIGSGQLCADAGLGSPDYITRTLLPSVEALADDDEQSPDFNICDLAFFRALAVAVRKRRRTTMKGPKKFDINQLVLDVKEAFEEYPAEELEKMWQHKSYVMKAVLKTKPKAGGSNYPKHDPDKRARK